MESSSTEDEWKILEPDILLFQTTIGGLDKPLLHPILDDTSKTLRIVANPVYEKLTESRAAQVRKTRPSTPRETPSKATLLRSKESNSQPSPFSPSNWNETTTKPIEHYSRKKNSRSKSPRPSRRQPTPLIDSTSISPTIRTPRSSQTSRQSRQRRTSSAPEKKNYQKQTISDGTIRYVQSRHGFEVQHYVSKNCLKVDVFSKDACQEQDKPFREMLEKKQQYERLSKSLYSSEYYRNRWDELAKNYKSDNLDHLEWAKQNYQALCLRTLYSRATQREQIDQVNYERKQRETRAQSAFKQWKEDKYKERLEQERSRLATAQSEIRNEPIHRTIHSPFTVPMTRSIEDLGPSTVNTSQRMSIATSEENEFQSTSVYRPAIFQKNASIDKNDLYLYDTERWSIQAMLKRVVGLAQPLPTVPKIASRKQVPSANTSKDSGFESV